MAEKEYDEELRMLRLERVLDLIPVSKNHIYRLIKEGSFPRPVKVKGVTLWSNAEIRAWYNNKMATARMLTSAESKRKRKRDLDDIV